MIQKTELQYRQTPAQTTRRQNRDVGSVSPQGDKIAQLEELIDRSPQMARQGKLAEMMNAGATPTQLDNRTAVQDQVRPAMQMKGRAAGATHPHIIQLGGNKHRHKNKYRNKQDIQSQKHQAKMQKQQQRFLSKRDKKKSARGQRREHERHVERVNRQHPNIGPDLKWYHYLLILLLLSSALPTASAASTGRRGRNATDSLGDDNLLSGSFGGNSTALSTGNSTVNAPSFSPMSTQSMVPLYDVNARSFPFTPFNSSQNEDQLFRDKEHSQLLSRRGALSQMPLSCLTLRDKDSVDDQLGQLDSMSIHDYRHNAVSSLNPSKGKGHVVGMAGLPGSGKSELQKDCTGLDYVGGEDFDDIGQNWKQLDKDYRVWDPRSWPRLNPLISWPEQRAPTSVKSYAEQGENVVMSDPEFIKSGTRSMAEQQVGHPIEWAFFENNPEQAKDNARFRKEMGRTEYDQRRNLTEELEKVDNLSEQYDLPEEVATHPIVNAREKFGTPDKLEDE